MKKKPIFGSGWKMFMSDSEALAHAARLKECVTLEPGVELFVLPSFTALDRVAGILAGTDIHVGAQNMAWEDRGAFTGEVTAASLQEMGLKYVEIGHTERRTLFGETYATVNRKMKKALAYGLIPVLCTGENADQKDAGLTREVLATEVKTAVQGIPYEQVVQVLYAYEPVWAIGKADSASAGYAQEMLRFIRTLLVSLYPESGDGAAFNLLYGGSVSLNNVGGLMSQPDIDGVFVGRASMQAASYMEMLHIIKTVYTTQSDTCQGG